MKTETKQGGIVYLLTNSAMPGLVKIGRTSLMSVRQRVSRLYSTGVPVPFECVYAARVGDEVEVEHRLHHEFRHLRVNPNREFFEMDIEQAKEFLKKYAIEDVTPVNQETVDVAGEDDENWEPWTIHLNVGSRHHPVIACEPDKPFIRSRWKDMEGYTASPGSWDGAYLNCALCLDIYSSSRTR